MLRLITSWACLASLATAVGFGYDQSVYIEGPFLYGSENTPAAEEVYQTAFDRTSNRSTVHFNRDYNYTVSNQESASATTPWNWTVAVASIPVPTLKSDLGMENANYSLDLRFVSTQWHLDFPTTNNKSLNELLYDANSALRANALYISSPAIVGRTFSSNGNCSDILGASCLQVLTDEAASGSRQFDNNTLARNCSSKLAEQLSGTNSPFTIEPYNASTIANGSAGGLLYSGGPLYYWETTTTTSGRVGPVIEQAEGVLQILILTPESRSSGPRASLAGPTVLCTVVDATEIPSAAPMRAASVLLALLVSSLVAAAVMW